MDPGTLARLERAANSVEIRELHSRYCRGIDRGDFDLVLSCYHEDATEEHAGFHGAAREFYGIVKSKLVNDLTAFHVTNVSVELSGDRHALGEAYYLAIVRGGGGPIDTFMSGRYLDRFERRDGVWRIAHRVATSDWWALVPRNQLPVPDGMEEKLIKGRRGLNDPYYAVRRSILGN